LFLVSVSKLSSPAFVAVLNDTIKPYFAHKGKTADEVEAMHRAWRRSLQLQIAPWSRLYMDLAKKANEWWRLREAYRGSI
jgi:hypothetical protein